MKISVKSCDNGKARAINERYGISLLASTVMARRGVGEDDVKYFLEEELVYQHSPFTVDDVYTAVERIEEALDTEDGEDQEKIIIYGDRDVDGMTSTAIMYRTLKKLGAKYVTTRLPHGDESYGLTPEIVKEIVDGGFTLCITVDNGISAHDEIRELELAGVSVILLDHHIPGDRLPPASAIFDPKVEGSGYPYMNLAGCAVAAKLSWALHFARTPLWNSSVILLHAEPGNGTIRINAVRLENLLETGRCSDEFVEGQKNSIYSSLLLDFLACGLPVLVLDKETETNLLRKAFGRGVDIALTDFRPQLEKIMPSSRGRSLFALTQLSRAARYATVNKELETLVSLFRNTSIYSYPELTKGFEDIQQLEAIGTIADLMPMTGENRLIVKKGLRLLSTRPLPCLSYLLAKQNLIGKPISSANVSFKISPVLNAPGRMGTPEDSLKLLLSEDPNEIESQTELLFAMNSQRQSTEEEAMSLVADLAAESFARLKGKFILIEDDRIPRGLTGSIASKLANEYQVPSLILATVEEKISGSIRCKDPWNAREFLSNFSYILDDFGGHHYAAGLRLDKKRLSEFLSAVESYIECMPEKGEEEVEVEVDAQLPPQFMTEDVWQTMTLFEPFGQENEELKFFVPDAVIEDCFCVGNNPKYMRLSIRYGQYAWPCVWWDAHDNSEYFSGRHVSFVFKPEINWWKGQGKEQINILSMEPLPV